MKRIIIVISTLGILLVLSIFYFIWGNNAPLTNGQIDFDIEFKNDKLLDLYYPTETVFKKNPVLVYFHGGGWIAGRKIALNMNRFNEVFNQLREKGYVIICPQYTLATSENSPFPDCFIDAIDALKWIKANHSSYNIDLNNVGLFGESAGATIAMMATYESHNRLKIDSCQLNIKYVIDVFGPSYLPGMLDSKALLGFKNMAKWMPKWLTIDLDLTQRLFGFDPSEDPKKADSLMRLYSPVNYISSSIPPTLVIHGKEDAVVPVDQSLQLRKLLESASADHDYYILDGVNHNLSGASNSQKDSIHKRVVNFIFSNYQDHRSG